jgi:uncharacterized protein YoxC
MNISKLSSWEERFMQTAITIGVIVLAIAIAVISVMLVQFFRNLNGLIKQTGETIQHVQMNADQIIARVDVSLEDLNTISKDLNGTNAYY